MSDITAIQAAVNIGHAYYEYHYNTSLMTQATFFKFYAAASTSGQTQFL